jgi:hypothetical protein
MAQASIVADETRAFLRAGPLARLRGARDIALALAILYAVLSAVVGVVHRAPAGAAGTAVVTLEDGSLAVICVGGGPDPATSAATPCDACLLAAAPGLPPDPQPVAAPPSASVAADRPPLRAEARGSVVTIASARGPPDASAIC